MRSQLAAWFLAFAALCLGALLPVLATASVAQASSNALVCTCAQPNPDGDLAAYAARVDLVVGGTLSEVAIRPSNPEEPNRNRTKSYDVAVDRVYQGDDTLTQLKIVPKVVSADCQLATMTEGRRYVFFVDTVDGTYTVGGSCSGTQERTEEVRAALEALFPLPPEPEPEPVTATRTVVDDSEPIEFARLAAPGAALVIVGALGLAIVGRLGRSSD